VLDGAPIAYIYVSSTPADGANEVEAFAASMSGKLTPVPGSPFRENVTSMAVNGKYLFAANSNGFDIDSYLMETDGALSYVTSFNAANKEDCNSLGPLFLDHTGSTLYDMEFKGSGCSNNTYESFTLDKANAHLEQIGSSGPNTWLDLSASFIGNNQYAYSAACSGNMYWGIYGFKRESNGMLKQAVISATPPSAPKGYFYCPSQAAADPSNHVAIAMQPVNQQTFSPDKPAQLATFTAAANGNLSTTSTALNMPETSVGSVTDLNMAPSGKLLAVGGTGGLQIFHFNGASPITAYTGLLTKDEIDQFFWDNQNNLYAISRTAGKLFVFTITPSSYHQASGSPYSIGHPQNIIVQPKL
jgi:6-phosphogluconolactonase (cycloisomerase 2 family)